MSGIGPGAWNDSLVAGIAQVCAGSDLRGDDMGAAAKRARAGLAAMTGIGPGDVIADMVAAQLVSAHVAAMDCYRRAAGGDLPLEVWREALNQANKLSRTSAALVEALNRHRGKSGQQTVRVEHVTVKDGGQAVIGPVATGGGGRGWWEPMSPDGSSPSEPATASLRREKEAPKSVGSNGETVFRLKDERVFEVDVWTFNRRCRLL